MPELRVIPPTAEDWRQPAPRYVQGDRGTAIATYERGPAGAPTVLLVHGFPDDHRVWDELASRLAVDYHVVTYDVRGSGASDRPRGTAAYRLDQLACDLRRVAAEYSPDAPVHLVGHDWGSVQGWHAVAAPGAAERFASFTSISGPYLDAVPLWFSERRKEGARGWAAILGMWKSPLYMSVLATPLLRALLCRSGMTDASIRLTERAEGRQRPTSPDRRRARRNWQSVRIYAANLPRLRSPSPSRIDVPVLVLAPRHDLFITVASQTHVPRDIAEDVQTQTIRGGHWAPSFAPQNVAEPLASFISQHTASEQHLKNGTPR